MNRPTDDISQVLARSAYFRGLSRGACERLATVCAVRTLRKREVLFREQSRGEVIYLLLDGRIRLHKTSPEGTETVIRTIRPGEIFAEVVLFELNRYPVTAEALTPSRLLAIARHDILHLLDFSDFRNDFIAMLMRKQRYLAERIRFLTTNDVEDRFFLFLREQCGEQTALALPFSKKDIAAAMGTTPETLSRLLRKLKKARVIQLKGKMLTLAPSFWLSFRERMAEE